MSDTGDGKDAHGGKGRAAGAVDRSKPERLSGRDRLSLEKRELLSRACGEMRRSMGLLKSSLWSIDDDDPAGPLLVDMARDAALRLQNAADRLEIVAGIDEEPDDPGMCRYGTASLVEECCRPMIPEFEKRGVTLEIDDRSGGRECLIDCAGMRLVLEELIGHALDSVGTGAGIAVVIELETCRTPGEGAFAGRGGSEEVEGGDRLDVSVRFERCREGRAPALEVCRRLTERQGGELLVRGPGERGREFVIRIPAD